jgi:hypothetical protein
LFFSAVGPIQINGESGVDLGTRPGRKVSPLTQSWDKSGKMTGVLWWHENNLRYNIFELWTSETDI